MSYADAVKRSLPGTAPGKQTRKAYSLGVPLDVRYNTSTEALTWQGVNYTIFNVPGDGSCFFHCLSLLFHGNYSQSMKLRKEICGYILENWEDWVWKIQVFHTSKMTYNKYLREMVNGHAWATSAEIEAATKILGRNIKVLFKGTNNNILCHKFTEPRNQPGNFITVLLMNQHFRLAVKASNTIHEISSNEAQQSGSSCNNVTTIQSQSQDECHPYIQKPPVNDHTQTTFVVKDEANSNEIIYTEALNNLQSKVLIDGVLTPTATKSVSENTHSKRRRTSKPKGRNTAMSDVETACESQPAGESTQTSPSLKRKVSAWKELEIEKMCRKLGLPYSGVLTGESVSDKTRRRRRLIAQIRSREKLLDINVNDLPDGPTVINDVTFDKAMDAIRRFELQQMSYKLTFCTVCQETTLDSKTCNVMCNRCKSDKEPVKMFSAENNMNPGTVPDELQDLTMVEEQLISKISPCINVHMLRHGGVGSSGHCVTFPQNVNEPAQIFPRLPSEISVVKVRKSGRNDTSREFMVRRRKVQRALEWLKINNRVFSDIEISLERLNMLPENGELPDVQTITCSDVDARGKDEGPAQEQVDIGVADEETHSAVLLNDIPVDVRKEVEGIVKDVVGPNHGPVTQNRIGNITIPWPTRNDVPLSEYTTRNFFSMAFPSLFPQAQGDFHINRPRTCDSMANWAQHLLWFKDGRFARHPYFKFVVHNIISRRRAQENCNFIISQQLGEEQITVDELREQLQSGNDSIVNKILYFSASLRGSQQYWTQKGKELRSLIQYKIHQGEGLPSFFTTGSCAEFYMKPLKQLLTNYIMLSTGKQVNLDDKAVMFRAVQNHSHIVAKYFDMRTKCYFEEVMGPVFGVNCYWYRQEFAKSRGMVHWHGLAWRHDKEPHHLLHECVTSGLSDDECAEQLAKWATSELGMSACHPAGTNEDGEPRKDLWPPPEGTAPPPPEEKNPLFKLLLDVSFSQETLLEDYLLLSNRFNLHRCSDYCWRGNGKNKICRMEFGSKQKPGKPLRDRPAICKDRNGCLRLELDRDHPVLVQHSRYHTQGWRANGDLSIILSKSGAENPSVDDIIATERYVTGYACKGNAGTGALVDLFKDIAGSAEESMTGSAVVSKFLMNTVKRDISSVEACFELSSLPLYRCTHSFINLSLSGSRLYEHNGETICKSSFVDKYLKRPENDSSSLYTFACRGSKVPVVSGSPKVSWPLVEDYCRSGLILHTENWRNLNDIKQGRSWVQAFEEFLKCEKCPNFIRADVQRAKDHYEKQDSHQNDEEDEPDCDYSAEEPEWMDLIRPNAEYEPESTDFVYDDGGPDFDWSENTSDYPLDRAEAWLEQLRMNETESILDIPNVDRNTLNAEQKFAFNIIMKSLQDYQGNDSSFTPLRLIIGGTAGSGKSYLIKCIVKAVRTLFNSNKAIQVLCPTGNSANIIGGMTLHSFLKLPTNKKNGEMKIPDGERARELQKNCDGLYVLLVDERSLIGATTLGWMEFLCRCGVLNGEQSEKSWGGLPVVAFFGDDVQLPPVLESPIYQPNPAIPAARHGALVWQEFAHAVILKSIVRQQGQEEAQFREVLNSVRVYETTSEQASWLQQFQWEELQKSYGTQLLSRISSEGLFIFPSKREEWNHNKSKLLENNQFVPIAKIEAKCEGQHSRGATDDKASGLPSILYLCRNAKVSLTANLNIKYGLYNRSPGKVIDIIYQDGKRPPHDLPDFVMVEFQQYSGPAYMNSNPKLVPITPIRRRVECSCSSCKRTQIPLRLGWGTTIHSCQGQTIGEGEPNRYIVINPGSKRFEAQNPGALFVALSRAKTSGGPNKDPDFCWHPSILVNEDRLCYVPKSLRLTSRCQEMRRIEIKDEKTREIFGHLNNSDNLSDFIDNIFSGNVI